MCCGYLSANIFRSLKKWFDFLSIVFLAIYRDEVRLLIRPNFP